LFQEAFGDQAQFPGDAVVGRAAIGIVANFIGMAVIFPLLGHASWHAYRSLVEPE